MSSDDGHKHQHHQDERTPLLADGRDDEDRQIVVVDFEDGDEGNPRNWTKMKKMVNVGIIALMAGT